MNTEKLDLKSPDLVNENFEKLAELFPNCVTEGAEGKAIDFDLLKQELSHAVVEGNKERYRLEWPGKREAIVTANLPTTKTLRPVREDSVDFDNTENLYIEGDNLEVLKLLQESYLGKIKMIYIDPPYNTGNDFVYKDNFSKDAQEELIESGQKDEYNQRLVANPETAGRYHSDWLSMMYPRLKLARNLLTDDGIFFVSIDDNEVHDLRPCLNEVFGESNLVGQVTWKARVKPVNVGEAKYRPQKEVEYVLVYQKKLTPNSFSPLYTGGERSYPHEENGRKYRLTTILKSNRGTNKRSTMVFNLGDYSPPEGQRWQAGEDVINQLNDDGYIEFRDGTPFKKYYEDEEGAEHDPFYCFMEVDWSSTSEAGKNELNKLVGNQHGFDTVKPVRLLKTLVQAATKPSEEHIILDFFSGSGTTAHAVMDVNSSDGGNRKYIQVQGPEDFDKENKGFKNVFDLGLKRNIASTNKIKETTGAAIDYGFRVYRLDESNMQDVYYKPQDYDQANLDLFADNVKSDRTADDLLAQVMLDWGLPLSLKIEQATISSKKVFKVAENSLYACFDSGIDEDFAKEIAKDEPLRIVFKDSAFKNDTAKTNVKQLLKQLSPETEMKVI
jgi:adenine-specific DNA-methyltransferase